MQVGQTTATTFPSIVQPFNVPYTTFGALGSNYSSNPLVTNTLVAHPMLTMPPMPHMASVPSISTFSSMPMHPMATQSPIALVLATTI